MIKLDRVDRLTSAQILTILESETFYRYSRNDKYFAGENVTINEAPMKKAGVPDNRIALSYARKICNTVIGYMFSRPAVYTSKNASRLQKITAALDFNSVDSKTYEVAKNMVVHGVGYELVYQTEVGGKPFPAFVEIQPTEGIPVYDYSISPIMWAFIHVRQKDKTALVDVWYADAVEQYALDNGLLGPSVNAVPHACGEVPVIVYRSDSSETPIFNPVRPLIDAVDKIASSDMNEIEKFALAIRVLYGGDIADATVKEGSDGKTLILSEGQKLEYLTRKVDGTFHGNVRDFLIHEIHKLSGVPDFSDPEFSAQSGIALEYKLMDFENICATLESGMRDGVLKRVSLVESILDYAKPRFSLFAWASGIFMKNLDSSIWVEFPRNKPLDIKYKLECAKLMREIGVSLKTTLGTVPGVDNVDEEMKQVEAEAPEVSLGPAETALPSSAGVY